MARPKLLTKEQVVDALSRWFIRNSVPPTVEELRRLLGVGSTRTVLRYLDTLKEEGYIERWSGARGLRMRRGRRQKALKRDSSRLLARRRQGSLCRRKKICWAKFRCQKNS